MRGFLEATQLVVAHVDATKGHLAHKTFVRIT